MHVEVEPGVVAVLPSWMLDAGICAGMAPGTPRVSVDALRDLNRLLLVRGFRRSVSSDLPIAQAQEIQDVRAAEEPQEGSGNVTASSQLSIGFESIGLLGLTSAERMRIITQLARLLMLAAQVAVEERDDER